jgi:hypothetical protein
MAPPNPSRSERQRWLRKPDFFALLCGGGIAVGPGVDTNSAVFGPGLITDAGYNQFNAHIQPGSGGIYNHAFGGCDYYDIYSEPGQRRVPLEWPWRSFDLLRLSRRIYL